MARSVRLTAKEFQEKHNRRTKAASADMIAGVKRVDTAPGKLAGAQELKMKTRLSEAIDNGKWRRRVESVTLEEWKADMLEKGVGRVSAGLDRAADKVTAFAEELIAHENSLMRTVAGMPDLTLSDSVQRATAWIEGMAKFERKS